MKSPQMTHGDGEVQSVLTHHGSETYMGPSFGLKGSYTGHIQLDKGPCKCFPILWAMKSVSQLLESTTPRIAGNAFIKHSRAIPTTNRRQDDALL